MPEQNIPLTYDAIVIGAGIGGLTTAALLTKAGYRVCIIEQDTQVGGYLANFSRKGFHFSTSIHWLNQCGDDGIVTKIFDFIAPGSPKARQQKKIRRLKGDSFEYQLTHHPDDFKQTLLERFPHEEKGIEKFFAVAREVGEAFKKSSTLFRTIETMGLWEKSKFGLRSLKSMLPFLKWVRYSAMEGLNKFFKDEQLKAIFCTEEDLMSCLAPIGWAYMNDFQHPPKSGSQAFPQWLLGVLKAHDADLLLKASAQNVLIQNGRVIGVQVQQKGVTQTLSAGLVVAACDIESLYKYMLPANEVQNDFLMRLDEAEMYSSSVTLYLGVDCDPKILGLGEDAIFLSRDDVSREDHSSGDPHKCSINVMAPSVSDPSLAPEGKGTVMIYVAADFEYGEVWKTSPGENGERVRGEAYNTFKKEYADILLKRVEDKVVPGLRKHIEVCEVATPVTFWRYTRNREGTMMGVRPGMKNMKARVAGYQTHIENLYISGHWAEYGGGVAPSIRAATNTTLLITQKSKPDFFKALAGLTDGKFSANTARTMCE